MTRTSATPVIRALRDPKVIAEAHRGHVKAPFFGCPLCVRQTPFSGPSPRWMSPRHA